jgi:hypothetical protein
LLYALLIIPHLAAIAGLLLYALRSNPPDGRDEAQGGSLGPDGEPTRPLSPPPTPPGPSLQAPREVPPRHRIRDADHSTHPARRPRREHPVRHSDPAPKADAGAQAQ